MKKNNTKGFTLIELLVVIAIIGILSSVVLATLSTARRKSRDARRIADLHQIQLALELYYDANSQTYPNALSALAPTYIAKVPTDPSSGSNYAYAADVTGSGTTCTKYHLGAVLEDTTNPALTGDVDAAAGTICTGSAADFLGTAASCSGTTAASPDPCYDITN